MRQNTTQVVDACLTTQSWNMLGNGILMFKASQEKAKINTVGQVMIVKLAYCVITLASDL